MNGLPITLLFLATTIAFEDPPGPENSFSDPKILLQFFQKQTRTVTADQIQKLIRQLGDDDHAVRVAAESALVGFAGRAVPALRSALTHSDPELRRRAEGCLRRIADDARPDLVREAARGLAHHRPPEAAQTMLDAVPSLVEESSIAAVRESLTTLVAREEKCHPTLRTALTDAEPTRRAAAAAALGQAGPEGVLPDVRRLLQDTEPQVRLAAALPLARRGERLAIPVVIALLADLPGRDLPPIEDLLYELARSQAPTVGPGTTRAERHAFRDAWLAWWKQAGATLDLKTRADPRHQEHTLVLLLDEGIALQLDAEDRPVWQMEGLSAPLDMQILPGDRLLLAESGRHEVTERHPNGTVLWRYSVDTPLVAQRLAEGRTFIGTRQELFEIDRDGNRLFTYIRPGCEFMRATRDANGEIHCVITDRRGAEKRFVRLDAQGRETASFPVSMGTYGGRIDLRPDGRMLLPDHYSDRIVELDRAGRLVNQFTVSRPIAAIRLANGNVLVTSMSQQRVVEFDAAGKEIWTYRAGTRVNRALRR